MLEETNRLTQLVDSLLNMSRAEAGRISLQIASVPLLHFCSEVAGLLEVMAEEKEQTLTVEGDSTVFVNGDRTILRQAIVKLIDNAVKFSPRGGKIRIRVSVSGPNALLEVHDDGPGISAEHQQRVFERFYRVEKARTRGEGGAGLGLSISQWAIALHGGTVDLVSEPGHGSTFRIWLPQLTPANTNDIT
jgi:signal transduction histidine kinase